MIRLSMMTFPDNTSTPVCLEIEDEVYVYGEDTLFEKLKEYEGYRIEVKHSGYKNTTKNYTIYEVQLNTSNGIPALDLRD